MELKTEIKNICTEVRSQGVPCNGKSFSDYVIGKYLEQIRNADGTYNTADIKKELGLDKMKRQREKLDNAIADLESGKSAKPKTKK